MKTDSERTPVDSPVDSPEKELDSWSKDKDQPLAVSRLDENDELLDDDVSVDCAAIPFKYRAFALAFIIFFSTGASFAENAIGPLKTRLRKELNITNAQFGSLASASALVNSILPIIGGIGMDYYGATYAALICALFVVIGAVVAGCAAFTNQYGLLIGGHILMGFGSTILESTQNKLYAHWFSGSSLGFVLGLDIAWNRVLGIVVRATAVPMSDINGWWGWALWIPGALCVANLVAVILYWAYERKVPKEYRPVQGRHARVKEGAVRKRVQWNVLLRLPKFFWILCSSQVLQNAAVGVYSSNLADIQVQTRGTKTLAAGYNTSLQGVIPIVLTPLTGLFFDRIGWRCAFISWTAALYIIVFALIGLTKVHPLAPILISSFALSTNAITFNACIPVIVASERLMGTAFGVWRSFQNCNSLILEVAAGAIQDRAGGSYNGVIYLLIAIKTVELFIGPIYDYIDGRWLGHSLRMPEKRRVEFRKEVVESGQHIEGWRVSRKTMWLVLGQLTAMIITGWTLYIIYSLGT